MSKVISNDEETQQPESAEEPTKTSVAPSLATLIKLVSEKLDADIYLYSGMIDRDGAAKFIEIAEQHKHRTNGILILTTFGGTADAAYKIARHFKRIYEKFILYVFGPCKSAGTLLALGADEIVMSSV